MDKLGSSVASWAKGALSAAAAVTDLVSFTLVAEPAEDFTALLQGFFEFLAILWCCQNFGWRQKVKVQVELPTRWSRNCRPWFQHTILQKTIFKCTPRKVELLVTAWPDTKYGELVTRLVLGCQGTAFQKLQLNRLAFATNDKKAVMKVVELLGGQWGQIPLEKKFEAERALYRCQQRSDETNDS